MKNSIVLYLGALFLAACVSEDMVPSDRKKVVETSGEVVTNLCSGVDPAGNFVYFPCYKQPALACATITAEGKIIYFVCGDPEKEKAAEEKKE